MNLALIDFISECGKLGDGGVLWEGAPKAIQCGKFAQTAKESTKRSGKN